MKIYEVSLKMEKKVLMELEIEADRISSPDIAVKTINQATDLNKMPKEYFMIMMLSTKNTVIHLYTVSVGTINASLVHPREVFQPLILSNSCSFLAFHNHPSGDPKPSNEDLMVTERLIESGKLLGIDLLDHIIVADDTYYSMKSEGVYDFN